jgi:hypothetical protein
MTTKTTNDFVSAILQDKPAEAKDMFKEILSPYIKDVITQRKEELSASMFNSDQDQNTGPEDEEEEIEIPSDEDAEDEEILDEVEDDDMDINWEEELSDENS